MRIVLSVWIPPHCITTSEMQREVYIHSLLERGELTKACVVQYEKISNSAVLWQEKFALWCNIKTPQLEFSHRLCILLMQESTM